MQQTSWEAQRILANYASRESYVRLPCPSFASVRDDNRTPAVLFKKFCDAFPYEPTGDQISAFDAIEEDMCYRTRPMDRLVVGDVGFGKTELALRAIMRTGELLIICLYRHCALLCDVCYSRRPPLNRVALGIGTCLFLSLRA